MKKLSQLYLITAVSLIGCNSNNHSEHNHDHEKHDHSAEIETVETHDHSDEIILDEHVAHDFGVKVIGVMPVDFNEVIKVSGRILPSSSADVVLAAKSPGIITFKNGINLGSKVNKGTVIATLSSRGMTGGDVNESTASNLEIAKNELERLKPLYEEQIIPKKDYIAAKNAYEQARIAYSGSNSGSTVSSQNSGVITELFVKSGEYVNAGQPVARVSSSHNLVLRADFPEKYIADGIAVVSANIKTAYMDSAIALSDLNGKMVATAKDSYPVSPGYIPVYFEFNNNGSVTAGSSCEVFLLGDKKDNAIVIPEKAIIEQMGQKYAFVKIDAEGYKKVPLKLGTSDGMSREVVSGINPGDSLVVEGVTFIKLAETKNIVPQGHTHNH
ncbi:MAG: efflux RND transporter periplasmic adaptor subunit [Lachnospiraceae bacterium]|nr:efflux RND transporter periplasmic adaptor subunit [Lachnospiraceae bacterium]